MTDKSDAYYARAVDWAVDQQAAQRSALRFARTVAFLAAVVAGLEALALLMLFPLKSVAVAPILVDRQTGYVEVLAADGRRTTKPNEALTRAFIARYVADREHFDIGDIADSYKRVALWSSDTARKDYLALTPASNPESPLRTYPRDAVVQVRIKSISPVGQQVALVRFDTVQRNGDGPEQSPRAWAAVVRYRFNNRPMTFEDRLVNPLGFEVVQYRRDPEALTAPSDDPGQAVADQEAPQ